MSSSSILRQLAASTSRRAVSSSSRAFSSSVRRQEHYLNANQEVFDKITSASHTKDRVVLVDFYADWCSPCKMLSPVLEKLTSDASTKSGTGLPLDLVTVNTDEEASLAGMYQIRSLPTVVAFKDGKPINQFIGAMNEAGVRQFLEML
ncbi:thioredoxin-like protein [Stereum hirsutum FP-91666 SS1]|uniref:thioredoxin-like protein n=1 Tax=Stereum hirsutum (strain FP-91666) TaxID=721885 RepID=UPI000440F43F|nr:thioredoxin-like protein [Stereum hirsutum FP-91666 SS1]EIM89595.1 thioredoxin-like protein [Stereum hirsutum FP-91666 SS1]